MKRVSGRVIETEVKATGIHSLESAGVVSKFFSPHINTCFPLPPRLPLIFQHSQVFNSTLLYSLRVSRSIWDSYGCFTDSSQAANAVLVHSYTKKHLMGTVEVLLHFNLIE